MATVEELQAAYTIASAKSDAARAEANRISKELAAAKLLATGLYLHAVQYDRRTWRSQGLEERKFLVERLAYSSSVEGRMIKKNGTLGERVLSASIGSVKDLGLYVAPTKAEASS